MERGQISYADLAACQVAHFVTTGESLSKETARELCSDAALWSVPGACFVSIKEADGSLRGCIGTIFPATASLGEELLANAVAACSRDPRFLPVTPSELPDLVISVDVLSTPELVPSMEALNPRKYGVVVSRGGARVVLLPDLQGVYSVEEQLRIACAKAGLTSLRGVRIERFTVERHYGSGQRPSSEDHSGSA